MEDSHVSMGDLCHLSSVDHFYDTLSNGGRIDAIVASVQGRNKLRKYFPNKLFIRILFTLNKVPNDTTKITIATIFHIQMEVLGLFQVFTMVVTDDVRVSKSRKNLEFGVQLFTFLL